MMRRVHMMGWLTYVACSVTHAQQAVTFDIDEQPLKLALTSWAKQTDTQILVPQETAIRGQTAPALRGIYTPEGALKALLASSELRYEFVNDRTVTIHAARAEEGRATTSGRRAPENSSASQSVGGAAQGTETPTKGQSTSANSQNRAKDGAWGGTEEVIVTASKREERLIETPQSVSVVSATDLTKLNATQFRDFAHTVPGLTFTTAGAGFTQVSLRGITLGQDTSPTVGTYVDEVPFGSSTGFAQGGQLALDVGLLNIDHIEVLRGPQGTLYGASTMGGLVKYVSRTPDSLNFSGQLRTGLSSSRNGGSNFDISGAVNIPIVQDKLALHASAFEAHDDGYINNVALGMDQVNSSDVYGGRLDLFYEATDALSIRLGAFAQNVERDGQATADYTFDGAEPFGSLGQRRQYPETFDQEFRLVSAAVAYEFAPATLTSISSYQTARTDLVYDFSTLYVDVYGSFGLPVSAFGLPQRLALDKFTQEIRLASNAGGQFDWLLGGFYTDEKSSNTQSFVLRDLAGQPTPNDLYTFYAPSNYEETAVFGNVTYHVTDKFDVTAGIRRARNEQDYTQFQTGIFGSSTPTQTSSETVSTYLANARYRFSENSTAYIRYATGYRPGGPNFVGTDPTTGLPVGPTTFEADRLKSYEIGYKAELDSRRFGIDVATYLIDWSNIQVLTTAGGFSVYANAPGGAEVRGAELTLTSRPVDELSLLGAFAYTDAKLTDDAPDVGGADDERLPNVPRFTATGSVDYQFQSTDLQPFVGATIRYVSDRYASFNAHPVNPQYRVPSYTSVDLRSGLTLRSVNLQVFATNLFDERGQLSAITSRGTAQVSIQQPRTIGVSASMKF